MPIRIQYENKNNILKFVKILSLLNKKSVEKLRNAINGLRYVPPKGNIKKQQGYAGGRKHLRVNSWRVIYKCYPEMYEDGAIEIISIIDIGNRSDIYK